MYSFAPLRETFFTFAATNFRSLKVLYHISIILYGLAIRLASLWNGKARQWVEGRRNWHQKLYSQLSPNDRIIWVHCSSAGEFEQGKPIIEDLKKQYPQHRVLVTFFSPSGYNTAGKYPHADIISYLPLDTPRNAESFMELVKPELVVFIKYEFWYYHLHAAAHRHIPILLASAVFREDQVFFKSAGRFFRQMLFLFRHIFVQDAASLELLRSHSINHCSIGGDTRFDRVSAIASAFRPLPIIESFTSGTPCLVAGSTWKDDEALLRKALGDFRGLKLVLAPHEIDSGHLKEIRDIFPDAVFYSEMDNRPPITDNRRETSEEHQSNIGDRSPVVGHRSSVLVIDNVGLLSKLYSYSAISFIGGGFTRDGIHNILEAAVYGKPVVFGPNYSKYREARELIAEGGAFSVSNAEELVACLKGLMEPEALQRAGDIARKYVQKNTGATAGILQFIQENRLLTR